MCQTFVTFMLFLKEKKYAYKTRVEEREGDIRTINNAGRRNFVKTEKSSIFTIETPEKRVMFESDRKY